MQDENTNPLPFNIPKKDIPSRRSIIKVIGVGGGGGNAVNNMFEAGITDVDFVIANTDIQVLENSPIPNKIQLGFSLTEGLGAGNNPEVGKNSATESKQDIIDLLSDGTKMVFVTAGMGGGTGTGAAPIIAQTAKELGILTIGIVTIPFVFEGYKRVSQAIEGLNELKQHVDAMIVIDNQKIGEVYGEFDIIEGFKNADMVLTIAAKGIAEIITKPGLVNVDFADVKSVMKDSGVAVMGTGLASGTNRAIDAVKEAINSPLLNNNDIKGAKNLLVNIVSPAENKIQTSEIKQINDYLQEEAGKRANLIWGITIDDTLEKDQAAVTVVATDFNDNIIPSIDELFPPNNEETKKTETNSEEATEVDVKDEVIEENVEKSEDEKLVEIIEKLQSQSENKIDYNDTKVVDEYDKDPAYLRQKVNLNFSVKRKNNSLNNNNKKPPSNTTENDFLNPMMD